MRWHSQMALVRVLGEWGWRRWGEWWRRLSLVAEVREHVRSQHLEVELADTPA